MTAAIAGLTTPAAATQPEPRAQSAGDSRFGAELESAKAAIGPDRGDTTAHGKPDVSDTPDPESVAEAPSTTGAARPTAARAPSDSAPMADPASPSAPTTRDAATGLDLVMIVAAPPVASGPAPTVDDAGATPAATQPGAAATVTAPTNTLASDAPVEAPALVDSVASPVAATASPTGGETKKARDEPSVPDASTADSAPPATPVIPVAAPVAPAPLPTPSAAADAPLPISVAPAAASGPMLAAAATDMSTPSIDVPQAAPANPAGPVSAVPTAAALAPTPVAPMTEASAPRPVDPPLNLQLARPLAALRSAGNGNHVITIAVTPENLGPVMVRAHVSGDAVRIELIAPTDQAREALKAIMPDLRRDLSQSGGQTSLDLSSGNQPSGREWLRDTPDGARARDSGLPTAAASARSTTASRSASALDVLV